ncbi:hypothetical protein GCM10012279_09930 [Micromonospora yangpuensis]|uniref:serine/threonine-protein kinase n=1 Tax=Micromonospora yangpuensis TaxID=683228 RepID=UPI0019C64854|nr:serine/threonine-protein kinase [Micromonospora yangpuensis]GGL94516.1 hypothetical protein GCM10012279_09930 [Micromonospora yangpuensis]
MQQELIAGRYRLLDLVGSGGMGRVWRARDEMLHRDVALKEIIPPVWLAEAERDEIRLRTLREARTAARLDHPNVVRIYDALVDRDSQWLVMEYVPSRSVQQIIAADGPLSPPHAARIGLAVLTALRVAHAAGVLHRDVKPHNVLVTEGGRVVLTDFGLATFVGGDAAMTGPGMVLGSPQYVAPERARTGASDPRSDLWSLGATLYAAVEGRSPYARASAMATLSALAVEPPDPPHRAGPLEPVLAGLLRRDPARRLNAAEVEPMLRAVADGEPASPGPPPSGPPAPTSEPAWAARSGTPVEPRWAADDRTAGTTVSNPTPARRRATVAVVAAVVLLAGAGGAVALSRAGNGPAGPDPVAGPPPTATAPAAPTAFACAGPPPAGATPVRPIPPPDGELALIAGWTWHLDPTGFRIAVPVGWLRWTEEPDRPATTSAPTQPADTEGPARTPSAVASARPVAATAAGQPANPTALGRPAAATAEEPATTTALGRPAAAGSARSVAAVDPARAGTTPVTCFREPGGSRLLSITPGAAPADPVRYWRAEERRLTQAGLLRDYEQIDISGLDLFAGGALWECRWRDARGEQVHSSRLLVTVSTGRAYTVAWQTNEFDWQVNTPYLLMIRQSFRPTP